jgi:hypothetical protein
MKRFIFALLAVSALGSSAGCCCLERLFCWGCRGPCGYGGCYGHEGPGAGCGCDSCGGGCSDCAAVGRGDYDGMAGGGAGGGEAYEDEAYAGGGGGAAAGPQALANMHPADGHPFVRKRRNAGGEYEFAAGPPSGGVTYPYYTNRGPRDFLARNPRGIGP